MRLIVFLIIFVPGFLLAQDQKTIVKEVDNIIFKKDSFWRGADGAATVQLGSGKVLWLFSDTFIDQDGTGRRSNSKGMIRNSIAIQDSISLNSGLTYYYKGTKQEPDDFFKIPGENWFWTGHGAVINDKLVIFLMEEMATSSGMGFESVGWYVAVIDNPVEAPDEWKINYYKGPNTFGVIVGSSAVLQDERFVYAFGTKEPATHETYLFRIGKDELISGDLSAMEWWVEGSWTSKVFEEPKSSSLFFGQTEFSVHYEPNLRKFIQIQTYGFGKASIGYRLADQLYGPWSEPAIVYTPALKEDDDYVYTANAHPEYDSDGLIVTYNINNFDFTKLLHSEEIYFPKIIRINFESRQ
ncbi:DUF4185 domain-containing protein [Sunxiuqinia dokdonensis]|uniref:DUF4185 domain-containing protein n=1 Tax=Sunxiuqinia dokdonensis TaxID=1409788 RepID=A0A0L8VB85_9BACT|nr:DUF4185 domain-containing protein [Sunxiuqinia dokdonensis]KOH45730.1 hypothetical protein NC99_14680 [Sunxiuqinia dokdonensis]